MTTPRSLLPHKTLPSLTHTPLTKKPPYGGFFLFQVVKLSDAAKNRHACSAGLDHFVSGWKLSNCAFSLFTGEEKDWAGDAVLKRNHLLVKVVRLTLGVLVRKSHYCFLSSFFVPLGLASRYLRSFPSARGSFAKKMVSLEETCVQTPKKVRTKITSRYENGRGVTPVHSMFLSILAAIDSGCDPHASA